MTVKPQLDESRRALLIPALALQDACDVYLSRLGDDDGQASRLVRESHRNLLAEPVRQLAEVWLTARVDVAGTDIEVAYKAGKFSELVESTQSLNNGREHHAAWDATVRDIAQGVARLIVALTSPSPPPSAGKPATSLTALQRDIINVLASSEGNTGKMANQLAIRRALASPPASTSQWREVLAIAESMVPVYFERGGHPGNVSYKLTVEGWLQWNRLSDVRSILQSFLVAYRQQFERSLQITELRWEDLMRAGANPVHHHLAGAVGAVFFLFERASLAGEESTYGRPIDTDEILDHEDVDSFIEYRRRTSAARAAFRNNLRKDLSNEVLRAVEVVYRYFCKHGEWPPTRRMDVEFRRRNISLRRVCQTRFVRGMDVGTDGATTSLPIDGLLVAPGSERDQHDAVQILKFLGTYYQAHPDARTVTAAIAAASLGVDEHHLQHLNKLLADSTLLLISNTGAGFDMESSQLHVSSTHQDFIEAESLEDVLLAEEERRLSLHRFDDSSVYAQPPSSSRSLDVDATTDGDGAEFLLDDGQGATLQSPLCPLGDGTYGHVYSSRDRFDRPVAVKFIRASKMEQASVIGHAKAMARANHRAMVTLYDVWDLIDPQTGTRTPALVMELLDGETLEQCKGPFTLRDFTDWSRTLVAFLRKLHQNGGHHGDLHAGNVMITSDGLRILDPYHRDSQALLSTRTKQSWHVSDVCDARRVLEAILLKTDGADDAMAAFRAYKPRLTTVDELAAAAAAAADRD